MNAMITVDVKCDIVRVGKSEVVGGIAPSLVTGARSMLILTTIALSRIC